MWAAFYHRCSRELDNDVVGEGAPRDVPRAADAERQHFRPVNQRLWSARGRFRPERPTERPFSDAGRARLSPPATGSSVTPGALSHGSPPTMRRAEAGSYRRGQPNGRPLTGGWTLRVPQQPFFLGGRPLGVIGEGQSVSRGGVARVAGEWWRAGWCGRRRVRRMTSARV